MARTLPIEDRHTHTQRSVSQTLSGMGDLVERLERLSKLKADGLLSEDEFARAKQQLLVAPAPAVATSASAEVDEVDEEERAAAVRQVRVPLRARNRLPRPLSVRVASICLRAQLRDRRRAANTKRRGGARSGGSAAASDLAAELSAAAAGVGARPQPPLPTIPAQFIASPGKPWTFKRAMSVCLVAIASVSFTLRILQGVRLLLACGDVDFVEVGAPPSVAAAAPKLRYSAVLTPAARPCSNRCDAVQWQRWSHPHSSHSRWLSSADASQ